MDKKMTKISQKDDRVESHEIQKWTGCMKHAKIVNKKRDLHNGGLRNMATQIAATPILYGEEAMKVWEEANTIPSEKARENGRKLIKKFAKMMQK